MKKYVQQGLSRLFSAPQIDRQTAVLRTERLAALTHLMSSAEHLARPQFREAGGLNNWDISRESRVFKNPLVVRGLDVVGARRTTNVLHAVRVAAAAGLAVTPRGGRKVRLAANAVLSATSLLLHPRNHYGTDGSDQASFLVQHQMTLARLTDRPAVQDAALWAVGLQGVLSYTVSGWVKLVGTTWRQGRALEGVTRTMTYGSEPAWKLFRKYPRTTKMLGASVLALECAAPLSMLPGGHLAKPYAAAATSLHMGIAGTMALGRFVPSFTALHPAMHYIARPVADTAVQTGGVRDGLVPRVAAAAALGAAATGAAALIRNRRTIRRGRGGEEQLTTADGASLTLRRFGRVGAQAPVVVFENALIGTPEHWEWVADDLGRDHEVVTYHRAGYGTSTPGPAGAPSLSTRADHLLDVVRAVADGRRVIVAGHSLGGYLALLGAARADSGIDAVVLVDSSHPEELRRSPRQAAGAEMLTATFPVVERSLKLGCAPLIPVAPWVKDLPEAAQKMALALYRDSGLWSAGRVEWAATLADFESAAPPRVPCPVLTLTAQATAATDPMQDTMHEEMAGLGIGPPRHLRIADSTHDSLLTSAGPAAEVAGAIREFLEDRGFRSGSDQMGAVG